MSYDDYYSLATTTTAFASFVPFCTARITSLSLFNLLVISLEYLRSRLVSLCRNAAELGAVLGQKVPDVDTMPTIRPTF